MILFVNACVRNGSRTNKLAKNLLTQINEDYEEIRLEDIDFPTVDEDFLLRRDRLINEGRFNDRSFDLARQFAEADEIVIAAPFWDLSFPASLKQYFEQINVVGITFRYTPEGMPEGLCRARRLTYVTTAGGYIGKNNHGYEYVKALCNDLLGIKNTFFVSAEGLDVIGNNVEEILANTESIIKNIVDVSGK